MDNPNDSSSTLELSALRMQPTFQLDVSVDSDSASQRIRQVLESVEFRKQVLTAGRCLEFMIEPKEQRFWSPHLSVQMSDTESGATFFGRFSPRPEIWTFFMAIYAVMAITIFGSLIYGYAQWSLSSSPWAFVLAPLGLLVIGLLHIASLIGQRLSRDQIGLLQQRFDHVLQLAFSGDQIYRQ